MRRFAAIYAGCLIAIGFILLVSAHAQILAPLLYTQSHGGFVPSAQVWSATQINSHLSGGGTTTVTQGGTNVYSTVYGTDSVVSGKWYWEESGTSTNTSGLLAGIGNTSSSIADGNFVGSGADSAGILYDVNLVYFYWNNVQQYTVLGGGTTGQRFGFALDMVNHTFWWENLTLNPGIWYGASSTAGDPATNSGGFDINQVGSTIAAHPVVPGVNGFAHNDVITGVFSQSSWAGTAPSGFSQIP